VQSTEGLQPSGSRSRRDWGTPGTGRSDRRFAAARFLFVTDAEGTSTAYEAHTGASRFGTQEMGGLFESPVYVDGRCCVEQRAGARCAESTLPPAPPSVYQRPRVVQQVVTSLLHAAGNDPF